MLALAPVFAYLFAFTALGFLLKRVGILTPERVRKLSWTALNVSLPALTIASLHRSPALELSLGWMPVASWMTLLLSCGIGFVFFKGAKLPPRLAASLFLPAVLGNVTFVGYPAMSALLGDGGLLRAIFFDQLASGIFFSTVAVAIAHWGGGGEQVSASMLLRRVLCFPPLWGLSAGFLLKGAALPAGLVTALSGLGATTTPFFLMGLGATLSVVNLRASLPAALSISAYKLLVMPFLGFIAYRALPMSPVDYQVAVLQTAMPSALAGVSLALATWLHVKLVVDAVVMSLLLSVVTLPFWVWLLGLA